MNTWGPRTTTGLIRYIQSAMPPSNPGGLSEEICSNIVAFFLQANGAPAGNRPLAISPEVRIGSVADGQMPPDIKAMLAKAANADQAMARATPVRKGLTVSGQAQTGHRQSWQ